MKKYFLLIATMTLLVGCGQRPIPIATSYAKVAQQKMQSAHHWDVLAYDVAQRLTKTINITFPNAAIKPPLVIKSSDEKNASPFGKAFFNLLTTRLVQQKLVVLEDDGENEDRLVVEYDMQAVEHKDRNRYWLPWVLTRPFAYWLPGETSAGVIITVSVKRGPQHIFGYSRVYYINEGDSDHYDKGIIIKTYSMADNQ